MPTLHYTTHAYTSREEKEEKIAQYYIENIDNHHITLPDTLPVENNVFHLFPILCSHRDELHDYLEHNGVGTLIHYPIPPHKQECYRAWNQLSLPVTEQIAAQELSLPIGPAISIEEAGTVVKLLNCFQPGA